MKLPSEFRNAKASPQTFARCPDFDMAPLEKFDRAIFKGKNPHDQRWRSFILVLALVYNDLHSLAWTDLQLSKGRSTDLGLSAYATAVSGVHLYVRRHVVMLFHELFALIRRNKAIIESAEFKKVVGHSGEGAEASWNELVGIATAVKTPDTVLGRALSAIERIRGDVTAHYYEIDKFTAAHDNWLANPTQYSEWAYASLGNRMIHSRFYFADGAIEAYINSQLGKFDLPEANLLGTIAHVNPALRFIVEAYLRQESNRDYLSIRLNSSV